MFLLPACTWGGFGTNQPFQFQAGQGQYVRPDYMNPAPTPRVPPVDACRSQLYVGLVGRHEGSIYIAGLPGRKRIIKPAFEEGFEYQYDDPLGRDPTFIEVRDYIPDQVLYAPSIRTVSDLLQLGPEQNDRLTIELDADGFVQQIRCQ
jgi:hypothetical protein